MARMARIFLPNTAQLVLVRGINLNPVFFNPADYDYWLDIIRTIAPNHAVGIHAYALIDNAVYLLATAEHEHALGKLMQDIGRRYVRYINNTYQRTGTLWEGRYRTAYIQDNHVINACVWLDNMSAYSSKNHHEGLSTLSFIADPTEYWQLGNTPFDRQHQYRQKRQAGLSSQTIDALTQAVITGWALGDAQFLSHATRVSGRRVTQAARGRPKKNI